MPRRVAVVSSSRADYGFIKPVLNQIINRPGLELELLLTGSHSANDRGTENEIISDNFKISGRIPIDIVVSCPLEMSQSIGRCISRFAQRFTDRPPDILVVIGDRYEMFAVAIAGITSGLPVAHISGGDLTEGVLDDSFRHALTKLSHIHFPSNQLSADRILQMGEEAWRVHVVGEPSLDGFEDNEWLSIEELSSKIGVRLSDWEPPVIVTLHAITSDLDGVHIQISNLTAALNRYQHLVVITSSNADPGGTIINAALRDYAKQRPKTHFVESLGWSAYASLMRKGRAMVGNSSSGILEAPSFELPVVNIGNRQRGRMRAANVIDVRDDAEDIWSGLKKSISKDFRTNLRGTANPYSDGRAAEKIVDILETVDLNERLRLKSFQEWR